MVTIQEEDEDANPSNSSLPSFSSLSSSHHNHQPTPSSPPSVPPPGSPDTVSSISSDHTFHGFSPLPSPIPTITPAGPPLPPPVSAPALPVAHRLVHDQSESVTKTQPDAKTGFTRGGGSGGRRERPPQGLWRREKMVKRVGLGLRACELVVCLVSLAVMATDKNRGWALDSFDRYVEFRYSLSANVLGFSYSAFQGLDLLLLLTKGNDLARSQLRCCFDFAMDQILAYLLLSATSSAFTRVADWISNWGQDKFPAMASASVGVSFIAFVAFACSSLISGFLLCTHRYT